ncbi:MAG: TetR/AcrR family transcriptional regulator [Spirochaetaceae bacterium]|nr:MAG: TetR/AcrR family transcriptional regulator [Spirochaetaceae bacterium]
MKRGERKPRRPGERADLRYEEIIEAAVSVYRDGGVEVLSMRSVARAIGVAPNALYSHVRDKADIVAGVIDSLLGEIESIDSGSNWKEAIYRLMTSSRIVLLRYGDLMPFFVGQATRGENAIRLGEKSLEHLSRAGLSERDAVEALQILLVYTVGFAAQEFPREADPDPHDRKNRSRSAFRHEKGLPFTNASAELLSEYPSDTTFERGLRWLIQGIELGAAKTS